MTFVAPVKCLRREFTALRDFQSDFKPSESQVEIFQNEVISTWPAAPKPVEGRMNVASTERHFDGAQ